MGSSPTGGTDRILLTTDETRALIDETPRRLSVRRVLVALLGFAAIGAIVAVAVVARSGDDALAELRVRGEVVDVVRGGNTRHEGAEGKDLIEGDLVRTDASGRAQIDLFDGSLVRVDTTTELALTELADTDDERSIELTLRNGRIWNRVAEQRSADERFAVRVGEATISVTGTTMFVDCRALPTCYLVEIDGLSEVSSAGDEMTVSAGDCVVIEPGRELEECNERKLGLLDDWVRENLAEDQQLELAKIRVPSPSPSPTPTARAGVPQPAPAPPAPTATPKDEKTPEPKDTPEPKKKTPEPTPRSTPTQKPRPTASPSPPPLPSDPAPQGPTGP